MSNNELISSVGRLLPGILSTEYFQYQDNIPFSEQRTKIKSMGASEVGSIFTDYASLKDLFLRRVLNKLGINVLLQENLYMKKGKANEALGFEEFASFYGHNFVNIVPNKYSNGVDMYSYMKPYGHYKVDVCATIDGFCLSRDNRIELIEIKYSDLDYLEIAIKDYCDTCNFIENKYFFKYYVQCQVQLACTGLEVCNLWFLVGKEPKLCLVVRNNSLLNKIFSRLEEFEKTVQEIVVLIRNTVFDGDGVYVLESMNDIYYENLISGNCSEFIKAIIATVEQVEYLKKYKDYNYITDFAEYIDLSCVSSDLFNDTKPDYSDFAKAIETIEKAKTSIIRFSYVYKKKIKKYQDIIKSQLDLLKTDFNIGTGYYYNNEQLFRINLDKRNIEDRYIVYKYDRSKENK